MSDAESRLLRLATQVAAVERTAYAGPDYKTYVEKKRRKGEKPLSKEDWEVKVLGKPRKEEKPKEEAPAKKEEKSAPTSPKAGLFAEEDTKDLPEASHQPVKTEKELFEQAKEAHEQSAAMLNEGKGLDKALGAKVVRIDKGDDFDLGGDEPVVIIGPPKKADRSREKVEAKYGGDWSQLKDIVRASVAVKSFDQLPSVVQALKKQGIKLSEQPEDRFANPTDAGYRDLSLNVEYPNGHIGELQLHVKSMIKAKDEGHKYYEDVRSIEAKAKKEGNRSLTDEEQRIVDEANSKMRDLYGKAWEEAMGGKAASMRTGAKDPRTSEYYNFDGTPARWGKKEFPVLMNGAKEVVYYDIEKFFREAKPITKAEYNRLVKKVKKASTEARLARLAAELKRQGE